MNSWLNFFFWFIIGAAQILSVTGLWFTAVMPGIDRWSRRFFRNYYIVLMACCLTVIVEMVLWYRSASIMAIYYTQVVECLVLSIPLLLMTFYLLHCCGESPRQSRLLRAVFCLWIVYLGMLASAMFFDGFSHVSPDGQNIRGPLYPLLLAPLVAILLVNLAGMVRRRASLSRKVFLGFLVALLPMMVALIVQMFADALPIIDISYILSAMSMYGFILSDQIERDLRHQREIALQQQKIASQRASIMVLQMRPHFIYNTMTSIYCLCDQDPQRAKKVVMDFTTYLRKNLTAISSAAPIQFSSELEHTRAYLAVEQAQYEDSLFVDYDTPHTFFRVPPLTLQPIVENAVKHGRDPYAGPFHISIRTRKTASGSEITVADDGRGFHQREASPSGPVDGDEPHIALQNIRQRLEIMCGGSLTIAPKDGGGTVVTVTIPDNPPGLK